MVNVWIFQCNPSNYAVGQALRNGYLTKYNVRNRHGIWTTGTAPLEKISMQAGDIFLLYETGSCAGIIALGTIDSDILEAEKADDSIFVLAKTKGDRDLREQHPRVYITIYKRLTIVEQGKVTRQVMKNDPILSKLSVITSPLGTNYGVTKEQELALLQRLPYCPILKPVLLYHLQSLQSTLKNAVENNNNKLALNTIKTLQKLPINAESIAILKQPNIKIYKLVFNYSEKYESLELKEACASLYTKWNNLVNFVQKPTLTKPVGTTNGAIATTATTITTTKTITTPPTHRPLLTRIERNGRQMLVPLLTKKRPIEDIECTGQPPTKRIKKDEEKVRID